MFCCGFVGKKVRFTTLELQSSTGSHQATAFLNPGWSPERNAQKNPPHRKNGLWIYQKSCTLYRITNICQYQQPQRHKKAEPYTFSPVLASFPLISRCQLREPQRKSSEADFFPLWKRKPSVSGFLLLLNYPCHIEYSLCLCYLASERIPYAITYPMYIWRYMVGVGGWGLQVEGWGFGVEYYGFGVEDWACRGCITFVYFRGGLFL